jgi:hypothetical protein
MSMYEYTRPIDSVRLNLSQAYCRLFAAFVGANYRLTVVKWTTDHQSALDGTPYSTW